MSKQKKYKYLPKSKQDVERIFDIDKDYSIKQISKRTGLGLRKLHAFARKIELIEYWLDGSHIETPFARDKEFIGPPKELTNKINGYMSSTVTLNIRGIHYLFEKLNSLESMKEFEDILKNKKNESSYFCLDGLDEEFNI